MGGVVRVRQDHRAGGGLGLARRKGANFELGIDAQRRKSSMLGGHRQRGSRPGDRGLVARIAGRVGGRSKCETASHMRSFEYLADGHHVDDAGNLISCTYVDFRDPAERFPITTLQKASSKRHAIPGCGTIRISKPCCFLGRGEGPIGTARTDPLRARMARANRPTTGSTRARRVRTPNPRRQTRRPPRRCSAATAGSTARPSSRRRGRSKPFGGRRCRPATTPSRPFAGRGVCAGGGGDGR